MTIYWPRRSAGLPPGQRLMHDMPRFTDDPFRPPPDLPACAVTFSVDRQPFAVVTEADLEAIGLDDYRFDFHCVTTWSVKDLIWTGVPLRHVAESVGLDQQASPYVLARAADSRRGHFMTEDALAPDVILATKLNGERLGERLGARHGGPLRLVAPQHYGYKSIKHLTSIDFSSDRPDRLGKEALRI